MLTNLNMIKLTAQIVSGLGVSKVVGDVIRNNVSVMTTFDAVKVWTGTLVITSMVVEQSTKHVNNTIDDVAQMISNR
jgi:hypothetical protein